MELTPDNRDVQPIRPLTLDERMDNLRAMIKDYDSAGDLHSGYADYLRGELKKLELELELEQNPEVA